jgi:hypothetical protein
MNNKFEMRLKEAAVACFKALSQCLPTGIEEGLVKPQTLYQVSRPRSETRHLQNVSQKRYRFSQFALLEFGTLCPRSGHCPS